MHLLEQQARPLPLLAESLQVGTDGVLEDVVAEDHAHQVVAGEALRQSERLRDAAGLVLHLVGESAAEVLAGAEQRHHVAHVLDAGHDEDLLDAGVGELAHRMEDHRLLPHRKKVLVGHFGERKQAGPGSAGEDDAFYHAPQSVRAAISALARPGIAAAVHGSRAPETAIA